MELGMGFLVGALGGCIAVLIVVLVVCVSRRAAGMTRIIAKPEINPLAANTPIKVRNTTKIRKSSPTTMIVDPVESRETELNKNIQEVRDLILRLAEVVGKTDTASGYAAKAFHSVRDAIDKIDLGSSADMQSAQKLLIDQIDRVVKTNATLQSELDRANQGIAEQKRQIEELRVAARMDGLTQIPNRAAFDERLNEYIALLDRANLMFTLLLIDIDHFKPVNDQYGHINGDRILRGVAKKISENIRANDFAARYGGEEFAVIFPATGMDEAAKVADRMRQDIARTNFRLDDHVIRITVSGGLAECEKGMKPEQILNKSDQALYISKNEGRNRITLGDGQTIGNHTQNKHDNQNDQN